MATGSIVAESPGGGSSASLVLPAHILWTKPDQSDSFAYVRQPPLQSQSSNASGSEQNSAPITTELSSRVFRLERNLRYLKSAHQTTLSKLYDEIEALRRRNKELQYELIVGTPLVSLMEEEAVDDEHNLLASLAPPSTRENATQTSVDYAMAADKRSRRLTHMEDELRSLRLALEDAETRNTSLSTLISQLKKSHMKMKSRSASLSHEAAATHSSRNLEIPAVSTSPSYAYKFQEYEDLVRRLKRENADQKQELMQVRTYLNNYRAAAASRQREHSQNERESLPRIHPAKSPPPRHNQARNKTIELPYIVQPQVITSRRPYDGSVSADKPSRSDRDRSHRHYVASNSPDRWSRSRQMHRSPPPQLLNHSELVRRTDRRKSRERGGDHKYSNR